MENEEKMMTGEESLRIITEMINKTKVNIRQGSFHLLFWGWLILICSLSEYVLFKFTDFSTPWYVWFFVIPGVFVSMIYGIGRTLHSHTGRYAYIYFRFYNQIQTINNRWHNILDIGSCRTFCRSIGPACSSCCNADWLSDPRISVKKKSRS